MKLGCHVNNNGKEMLLGSIKEAISYGANCFMVYLGAPQNTVRKPYLSQNASEMAKLAEVYHINLEDVIVHAPYVVNLARSDKDMHDFSVRFLSEELHGIQLVGAKYMVLHPGSCVDSTREVGHQNIARGINEILANTSSDNTVIAIETMAGKGNEAGKTFEEVKSIIDLVEDKSRIGVCLDTCHINDGGYDLVNNYEEVITLFDKIIGLKYLSVIHLNDSKNPLSSHKDRHENIGFGTIGFDTIVKVANDSRFSNICKILETPYVPSSDNKKTYPPYKEEIEMIKSNKFNPNLKEDIIKNYDK